MPGDVPMVTYWEGRPITELSREELIEALTEVCGDYFRLLKDRLERPPLLFRNS
jgi:hypothetical protein